MPPVPHRLFTVQCGACRGHIQVQTDWIGQQVQCGLCRAMLAVPPPPAAFIPSRPPVPPPPPSLPPQPVPPLPSPPPPPLPAPRPTARTGDHSPSELLLPPAPGRTLGSLGEESSGQIRTIACRPLQRLLLRLYEIKQQVLAHRSSAPPPGSQASASHAARMAELQADIRETIVRIRAAIQQIEQAMGEQIFPMLETLRNLEPASSDREIRDLLREAMKRFGPAYTAWEAAQNRSEQERTHTADQAQSLMETGVAAYHAGRYIEARAQFGAMVELQPLSGPARRMFGLANLKLQQYVEAVQHLSMALVLGSESAPLHYDLALALLRSGQVNAAARQLHEALRIDPNLQPAQRLLERIEKPS